MCVCMCEYALPLFFKRGEERKLGPSSSFLSCLSEGGKSRVQAKRRRRKEKKKKRVSFSFSSPYTSCVLACVCVCWFPPFLPLLFFHTQSRRRRRKGEGEKGEEAPLFSLWYISCPPPPLSSSPGSFRPFSLPLCHRQVVRGNLPAEEEEEEEAPRNRETHFSAEQWSDGNKRSEMRSSV